MRSGLIALALAMGLAGAVQAAEDPRIAAVDAAIQPMIDKGQLAGAVLQMHRNGKLVHRSALGMADLEAGTPVRTDSLFRVFSMTKPVTAVAMMVLYDEGRWKPEDPVSKFLPELAGLKVFKGMGPDGKPILEAPAHGPTMGQLMTHTAGFSYGFGQGYVDDQYRASALNGAASPKAYVDALAALPLAYEPGTRWQYSVSMDVQGRIIERITGQSLADFMHARIFGPLKMKDTGFFVPAGKAQRLVKLYTADKDGKLVPASFGSSDLSIPPGAASGGGGLISTSDDYSHFARMLLKEGELDGTRIISAASARQIMTNHIAPEIVNGGYGIGFQQVRPGYQFGYNGVVVTDPAAAGVALGRGSYLWDGAAMTWFWVDPTNKVVFVGMVQRLGGPGAPAVQPASQQAVKAALAAEGNWK